jgi:large subunit ribosomal protein L29
MTMAKTSELRDKSLDELREEERRLAQQVFKNRMELAAGQLTNVRVLSAVKRELARVKTLIREKSNQQ